MGKSGIVGVGGTSESRCQTAKSVRFDEGEGLFEDDMSLDFHRNIDIAADRVKASCSVVVGGSGSIGVGGISEHVVRGFGIDRSRRHIRAWCETGS